MWKTKGGQSGGHVKAHYLTDVWFVSKSFVSNNHCSALHQWVSRHVQHVAPYFPCSSCQVGKMGQYADDTNTLPLENIILDLNFTCSCLMTLINNEEKNNQNSDAVQIRGDIFCCFFPIPRTQVRKTFVNTWEPLVLRIFWNNKVDSGL